MDIMVLSLHMVKLEQEKRIQWMVFFFFFRMINFIYLIINHFNFDYFQVMTVKKNLVEE